MALARPHIASVSASSAARPGWRRALDVADVVHAQHGQPVERGRRLLDREAFGEVAPQLVADDQHAVVPGLPRDAQIHQVRVRHRAVSVVRDLHAQAPYPSS